MTAALLAIRASPARLRRLQGADREATAASVATRAFFQAGTVVIVRADQPADGLAALYLAGTEQAALLYSGPGGLGRATMNALIALGPRQALIVGDDTAVPLDVDGRLAGLGIATTRLAAPTRYGTAAVIAQASGPPASFGALGPTAIVLDDADAARYSSVGALAYGARYPVLYARDGALPPETAAALVEARVAHVLLLGGAGPVAPTLQRMGISSQVLARDDGPATSAAIGALETFILGWAPHRAVLARGDTFPDALAAGQLAGSAHVPLIVTEGTGNLGAPAEDYLRMHGPLSTLDIVGDPSAITPTAALDAAAAGDCCKG